MKCLFLEGRNDPNCKALQQSYVPSSFELEEYCKSNKHKMCPLYLGLIRQPWAQEVPASNSEKIKKLQEGTPWGLKRSSV